VEIFAELLALLLMTRALGEAAERLGQPASVGELSAGILLALAAAKFGQDLPFLDRLASSEALEYAANLGIFFLVLLAGVELDPREIRENSAGAFVVALGGMALPLLGGLGLAWIFLPESELKQGQVLLVGVALSISAIPATVKVFTDLGLLHARVGQTVISAAVFDDVLGLFLLAVLLALLQTGQVPDVATLGLLLAKVAGFFVVTIALGTHVYPRVRRGLKLMQAAAMEFSALVAVALAYGFLAELLGLHWILGAFMAGLYFAPSRVGPAAYASSAPCFSPRSVCTSTSVPSPPCRCSCRC
jgi:Kef-type K+ transport system membrane component KefB